MGLILRYSEFVTKSPCKAFCLNCGGFVCFGFIFVILVSTLGEDFFNYQVDAPLYLLDNRFKERDDAVSLVISQASENSNSSIVELERSNRANPLYTNMRINVLYVVQTGSIYDMDKLKLIQEFEKSLWNFEPYQNICQLDWSESDLTAMKQQNVTRIHELNSDTDHLPGCIEPLSQMNSMYGISKCSKGIGLCSFEEEELDEAVMEAKLKMIWDQSEFQANMKPFYSTAAGNFGRGRSNMSFSEGIAQVVGMQSNFFIGVPFKKFTNSAKNYTEQNDELDKLTLDSFLPFLNDAREKLSASGVDIVFDMTGLRKAIMLKQVPSDVSFAVFSFIFVFVFMTATKRSLWLSSMGMGMILLSFFPAYLIYWGIFRQSYFGVFNLLSIFIILGVGADDVFVFVDTWFHSAHSDDCSSDVVTRMRWTLKRAGGAMLVTSLTTMSSFMATARSQFPGISTFGLWAGSLVIANYIGVITFFPSAVSVYNRWIRHSKCWCSSCASSAAVAVVGEEENVALSKQSLEEMEDVKPIVKYFGSTHATLLNKHKLKVIGVFSALVAVFAIFAAQLEVDPESPKLFAKGHIITEYPNILQQNFASPLVSNPSALKFSVVHGLERHPIDRNGTNPTIPLDQGKPVLEKNFTAREVATCLLAICDKLDIPNETLGLEGSGRNKLECWPRDFLEIEFAGDTDLWNETVTDQDDSVWKKKLQHFVQFERRTDILLDKSGEATLSRINLETSVLFSVPFSEGIAFLENWEETVDRWYSEELAECAAVSKHIAILTTSPRYGQNFYVAQQLVKEAFSGILMSLVLAFFVLAIFSGNVLVAAIAIGCILLIVLCVIGYIVMAGMKLGMLESINLTMCPGLSVDFVAHLAEGYIAEAKGVKPKNDRVGRMTGSISHVGVSIISGAISTAGACVFLFFPTIKFFVMFGTFIFVTIAFSLVFALFLFPSIMFLCGPEGTSGAVMFRRKPGIFENNPNEDG